MGTEDMNQPEVTLVVFTCQGREHLLERTVASFNANCDHRFASTILAIDGPVNMAVAELLHPDLIIQQYIRKGYVHMIAKVIKAIETPFFFWLEDDWLFNKLVLLDDMLGELSAHPDWAQIVLSKHGSLDEQTRACPLGGDLYRSSFGFSANPTLCNTHHVRQAFEMLASAKKGDTLGEDGFENFLTRYFRDQGVECLILDSGDRAHIHHEGYLETTPRNWHMTNSLEQKTSKHLLTIPRPSFSRRLLMVFKLALTMGTLALRQLTNNKIYEHCFRIIATSKTMTRDD